MKSNKLVQNLKSPRILLTVATLVALVLIIFLSKDELAKAIGLLGQANIGLLLLLIPFQIIVYFSGGEMIFSYLRRKKLIKHISWFEQTRIALELNLVNHIFPSGGISGISYATWRMHKLGVNSVKSTFAQMIRYVSWFVALMILMVLAVAVLALDGQVNRYIVSSSFILLIIVVVLTFWLMLVLSSEKRMLKTAKSVVRIGNKLIRILTFGKMNRRLEIKTVEQFFIEMHMDFEELAADKGSLVGPLLWGAVLAIFDVLMFVTAFWALGYAVNPAILLVGYGVAGLVSIVAITPGGAGVYEVIMIFFLTMAGISADVAIAGIVLTRAILLTGTIVFGYMFYQQALWKYGKRPSTDISS